MKINCLLAKENNNIDLIRLIAALMVIYGHAYAIMPTEGHQDFILKLLKFDYSGSLAVKLFFFLSGLVVANSLFEKKRILDFLISRVFRIFPGLIVVVVLSALLLGPAITTTPVGDYFSDVRTYQYIYKNIFLSTTYMLPGVFENNSHPNAVNGSLWTLPHEVYMYVGLLAFFMAGIFRAQVLVLLLFAVFLVDPIIGNRLLFTWRPISSHIDYLAPCFSFGVIVAYFKDRVAVNMKTIIGIFMLFLLFKESIVGQYLFYMFFFFLILLLSGRRWLQKMKPHSDISYGVYLFGFPVQQTLANLFPVQSTLKNQMASSALCILLAWILWHGVEKHSIKYGRALIGKLRGS